MPRGLAECPLHLLFKTGLPDRVGTHADRLPSRARYIDRNTTAAVAVRTLTLTRAVYW